MKKINHSKIINYYYKSNYTLWNERRMMIQSTQFDYNEELKWLITVISTQPKSYWTWNHRLWCINEMDLQNIWQNEFKLIDFYLKKDCRNFHVWDYRKRLLIKQYPDLYSNIPILLQEFEFTANQIKSNFSNYSAWHWRYKIINALKPIHDIMPLILQDIPLITTCFYSDPRDQSAWFYYLYLISISDIQNISIYDALSLQYSQLQELNELEPNCKWIQIGLMRLSSKLQVDSKQRSDILYDLTVSDAKRSQFYQLMSQ
eukprot:NODE_75_length_23955_cov_0.435069.p12 type:complete len:259 gc:universal NODE_75_length_23955_cov_0.435069:19646-18870(-)